MPGHGKGGYIVIGLGKREKGKEVFALEQVTIYQSSLASNNQY